MIENTSIAPRKMRPKGGSAGSESTSVLATTRMFSERATRRSGRMARKARRARNAATSLFP